MGFWVGIWTAGVGAAAADGFCIAGVGAGVGFGDGDTPLAVFSH